MESNTPEVIETQETTTGLNSESAGIITPNPSLKPSPADNAVQEYLSVGSRFLSQIFDYLKEFVDSNQKSLINLLLIFLGIIAVKVTLAIISAINDVPLLAPTSRQELSQEFQALKNQVMGQE